MPLVRINEAEAILDPFWDPSLSELNQWAVEPGIAHGLKVSQNWCWVTFEWARRPVGGTALRLSRRFGVDCRDYDTLVLSVTAPPESVVRLQAETDRGPRRFEAPPAGPKKREIALELGGATRLECVTLEVDAGADGIAHGWFNWLGLQHSGRLAHKLASQTACDPRWERHLKDERFEAAFTPAYGLVLNSAELDALRTRHAALTADGSPSPFLAAAEAAGQRAPEGLIHDFVNFWGDSRYNRVRDHGKFILNHGLNVALAGHLLRDKRLLRLAARYAMSLGMCKNWDDGFICRFPGSTFEHRCFVQSLCAYEVAGILDLAGECFTDIGRDMLLRRLAEEAIGAIQFNTWRHDYIFGCNQLAWFTPGRMLALGVLQRHWPRVRPYLDIAYRELCESLERSILPDGGYAEGPTYFRCVGRDAGLGVYYYSRAVGQPMTVLVPAPMRRCGDFAEAVISTDAATDVVPICDAGNRHEVISQALMAELLPESAWPRMLHKAMARNGGWPVGDWSQVLAVPAMVDAAIAWGVVARMAPAAAEPRACVCLPAMGPLVSHRRLGGEWVKLLIQGNQAGAGHTHEDKGSFVLEFAGETFACDPGTCDYSHPLAGMLKNCERHTMLVPTGTPERPHPACPLPHDVKPAGTGDETAFHAEIDATPGWEGYFRRWHRTWDSPTPAALTITDEYELAAGDGVVFYWQTRLPVTVAGSRAVIVGARGRVELTSPEGCAWRMDELSLLDGVQRRLACRCAGVLGRMEIQVRLVSGKGDGKDVAAPFSLEPTHVGNRLDGCAVSTPSSEALAFTFARAGRFVAVLLARAPLRVATYDGVDSARLRPGWDGTLGYALYALEIEAPAAGTGSVRLEVVPVPVNTVVGAEALAARPSRFPDAPAAFRRWQADYRARLASRLMNGGFPGRVPLAAEVTSVEERTGFTLRRVSYQTHADRRNTLLLSLPSNSSGRLPLLVALHGHEAPWGEADAGAFTAGHADDFCAYFAERGWAVVQPATMDHALQHPGWTLQGEWTWDAMVALDYALVESGIAADRVAVCGLSTGAHLAMNLLALDDRVQSGVVGCILSPWHHYRTRMRLPPHCDCGISGQLGDWLETCDWAALAAPKPVQFQHGRKDAGFCPGADPAGLQPEWNTAVLPEAEFALLFAEVERAWRLAGAGEAVTLHTHAEGHRVDAVAALTLLERHA